MTARLIAQTACSACFISLLYVLSVVLDRQCSTYTDRLFRLECFGEDAIFAVILALGGNLFVLHRLVTRSALATAKGTRSSQQQQ